MIQRSIVGGMGLGAVLIIFLAGIPIVGPLAIGLAVGYFVKGPTRGALAALSVWLISVIVFPILFQYFFQKQIPVFGNFAVGIFGIGDIVFGFAMTVNVAAYILGGTIGGRLAGS